MNADEMRDLDIYRSPLSRDPSSVGLARLTLRAALWDWRLDHLTDTAQLIISELATNASKLAGYGMASVYLLGGRFVPDTLAIEVMDDSPVLPAIVAACPGDEGHRGLVLVDALASKWGAEPLHIGKVVWAHLEYDEKALA